MVTKIERRLAHFNSRIFPVKRSVSHSIFSLEGLNIPHPKEHQIRNKTEEIATV